MSKRATSPRARKPRAAARGRAPSSRGDPGRLQPALAVHLPALVDYAPGSIVSRTLVQTDGGSVTLFAFDQGQELSEHTSPAAAFVHVIDGMGRFRVGERIVNVPAGHAMAMPAGVPHAVLATERFAMLLTMLRGRK